MKLKKILYLKIALLFCCCLLRGQDSSWMDKVQILGNLIVDFPATGGVWGITPTNPEWTIEAIDHYRSQNGFFHSYTSFTDDNFNIDSSLASIDFNGQPMATSAPGFSGSKSLLGNIHHPEFQDTLIKIGIRAIDLGSDGLMIDGYAPNVRAIMTSGGSFDEYTLADFRSYLKAKFSMDDLNNSFGINDISNFSYKDWLDNNNMIPANDLWSTQAMGLHSEFLLFEYEYAIDHLSKFSDSLRIYAHEKFNKDFWISENAGSAFYFTSPITDYITSESFYYDRGRKTSSFAASNVKLGLGTGHKKSVIFPEIVQSRNLSFKEESPNLIKLMFADIYGSGGTIVVNRQIPVLNDDVYVSPINVDHATITAYSNFILRNRSLFENISSNSKIGLAYSATSRLNAFIETQGGPEYSHPSFFGMSELLIESNIQFDVVFLSDPRFYRTDTIENLEKYNCIIIPNIFCMSETKSNLLLDYVNNGGVIFASGRVNSNDQHGNLANRPTFQSLLQKGEHNYGDGKVIYFEEDFGRNYLDDQMQSIRSLVAEKVNEIVNPDLEILNSDRLSAFVYRFNDHPGAVVHFVNYDYEPVSDRFALKENIEITWKPDTIGDYRITYFSPDISDQLEIGYEIENGSLKFNIPSIEAYGIIKIEPALATDVKRFDHVDIGIFPNPTSGFFSVSASKLVKRIDVFDVAGNLISTHSDSKGIYIRDYGVYILKIITNGGIVYKRIIRL